jgi:hypothetical protein
VSYVHDNCAYIPVVIFVFSLALQMTYTCAPLFQVTALQQGQTTTQQDVTALGPTLSGVQQRLDTITTQVCVSAPGVVCELIKHSAATTATVDKKCINSLRLLRNCFMACCPAAHCDHDLICMYRKCIQNAWPANSWWNGMGSVRDLREGVRGLSE